jgi:predicted nucleotidyltransferase
MVIITTIKVIKMGLLKIIKEDKDARKVFGKRELKIIEKQLLGVNLTQSEKNRLSRDIRKKLEFIRRIAKFEDDFQLKKGAEIKRMIEEAKEIILEDQLSRNIRSIILYGSAAENLLTLKSDIDLAVKIKGISLKEATLFRKRISGKVDRRIDIQVYDFLPDKIKKDIDKKGRTIHPR